MVEILRSTLGSRSNPQSKHGCNFGVGRTFALVVRELTLSLRMLATWQVAMGKIPGTLKRSQQAKATEK